MEWLLENVYAPAEFFILHPERAFLMAAGYLMLVGISMLYANGLPVWRHLAALVTAMLWGFLA
ncbi:MAG: hypothetical protein KF708_08545 [Pirellulales bacterium]|nr:hypothetical protein [Pirellulales bacterium]